MEELTAVFTGIGLAAACGFRVFVPLFLVSLSMTTGIEMPMGLDETLRSLTGEHLAFLGNPLVTTGLGVATAVEVGGFYVPWLDNLLDTLATPAAILAGTAISGAFMPEVMGDGFTKWAAALIAGGGASGLVQTTSVLTRGASSATTGGIGNPLVATFELAGSVLTTFLAVLLPLLVLLLLVVFVFLLARLFRRRKGDVVDHDPGTGNPEEIT